MDHQDIIEIVRSWETIGEFFIQPAWHNPFLMIEEQDDIVICCCIVVGQVIIDETAVPVYPYRSPIDVFDSGNHQGNGARGRHGVLEVDRVKRNVPSTETWPQTKGRRFWPVIEYDTLGKIVDV